MSTNGTGTRHEAKGRVLFSTLPRPYALIRYPDRNRYFGSFETACDAATEPHDRVFFEHTRGIGTLVWGSLL